MRRTCLLCLIVLSWLNSLQAQPIELRGVWLTNVDSEVFDDQARIAEAMRFLSEYHFNAVFPVVWNDAKTVFPSALMDSLFGLRINPRYEGRDPLAELIAAAEKYDIAVIPWFEYGFAAAHEKQGGLLIQRKPHWAERDHAGNLLKKNGFEWLNPFHPEVQQFVMDLVREVVRNYEVAGVQGDDRLPALPIEGGYSDFTQRLFAAEHGGQMPPYDFRETQWQRWRADKLNDFTRRFYQEVKAIKPECVVSWAPSIYPWSYDEYLQDWPGWIQAGCADLIIPQAYRYNLRTYRQVISALTPSNLKITDGRVFPGVLLNLGDYIISEKLLLAMLKEHRRVGYAGEVFFFYEGLRKDDDRLAKALVKSYYGEKARRPF